MKKRFNKLLLLLALTTLSGCGGSEYTSLDAENLDNFSYDDPITPYEEQESRKSMPYRNNHCQDINVEERVFIGESKSILNRRLLEQLLEDEGVCTNANNGFQSYPGFLQYEVHGGTNRCSWWSRHGLKVYINFRRGYKEAAVVTLDVTGDGWPQGGGQGFPTGRIQFRNALIDCNQEDLTINVDTHAGRLQIRAPKETGNKYSSDFRATLSYQGSLLSRGFYHITW